MKVARLSLPQTRVQEPERNLKGLARKTPRFCTCFARVSKFVKSGVYLRK